MKTRIFSITIRSVQKFVLVVFLLFFIKACDKENEEDIDPELLSGSWKLVSAIEKDTNDTLDASGLIVNFNKAKCLTIFCYCNIRAAEYSIEGKRITIHPAKNINRCNSLTEEKYIKGLTGRYEIECDTFKVVSDENVEYIFYKTNQSDPYKCELSTLLTDSIESQSYYVDDIFDAQYRNLYGKWFLYEKIGGWAGGSSYIYYDFLEIKENGIYGKIKGTEILEHGKIHIYNYDESSLYAGFIDERSSNIYPQDTFRVYFKLQGTDSLILQDACLDCYRRYLVRID